MTIYKVDVTCHLLIDSDSSSLPVILSAWEVQELTESLDADGFNYTVTASPVVSPKMPNKAAIIEQERESFKPAKSFSWANNGVTIDDWLAGRVKQGSLKDHLITESDNA